MIEVPHIVIGMLGLAMGSWLALLHHRLEQLKKARQILVDEIARLEEMAHD